MSRSFLLRCCIAIVVLVAAPTFANATLIELPDVFGTGLKADGTLATAGSADLHYYFYNAPISGSYATYPNTYVTDNTAPAAWPTTYSSGSMNPDYAILASWISPRSGYPGNITDPDGDYVYRTSFTVPINVSPSSVLLYGAISSDNCTGTVSINGHAVTGWSMTTGTCIGQPHYFQIGGSGAAFLAGTGLSTGLQLRSNWFTGGVNTIDFTVNNAPGATYNPSGMVVWLDGHGTEMVAPEPGTIILVLAGMAGLSILRKKLS